MSALRSLAWEGESLRLLDQTKLPGEITYLSCKDYREVADAIRTLSVRGAPAIGVAAAMPSSLPIENAFWPLIYPLPFITPAKRSARHVRLP